ncbi:MULTISPECIES: CHASE3 domain-containing protein [Cyanophyceae]|uniref:sensor histidine kinase n=1 Tax=Cyanophyceae TaxID=3028117 RepID=UPI001681CCE0|nr:MULTISPECIES: CHASE3 domain-containing protein [Cyanophyceae]MBD1915938.1 CHASE3 domain-containing protein [Phormidium sp. FACHB-77]MBD2030388.1 CHASE3 domain-containing protein [Phormidium sp. FACHB-322]MBD2053390.1 CHASE3 domain-containing protein [Leptolyngbya sp. FACHB-60]
MVFIVPQDQFRRRLIGAIALPVVLLLLLSGVSIWQITRLLSALDWVDHTGEVISQANSAQKLLLDMETGFRGYLLTGEQEFLEPYEQANRLIEPSLEELKTLVSDNPSQVQRIVELTASFQRWEQQTLPAIALRQQGELEPLNNLRNRKQLMDQMRQQIAAFISTEEGLRDQRSQTAQTTTQSVILTSLLLALGIGAMLAYFIYRQILWVSLVYKDALQTAQLRTKEAEQSALSLQRSAQRLATLHDIDRAILAAELDKPLIGNALTKMRQIVPFHQAFVALFDLEAEVAQVLAGSSPTGKLPLPVGTRLTVTDFAPEQSMLNGVRYVQNLATAEACPPVLVQLRAQGFLSCLCVPLQVDQTLIGELNLASTEPTAFDAEAQEIAYEVANQLAIALQQTRLRTQLQDYATQLEQRVSDRTAQLEETNQELEAFTYSVSHDLRAPLRTIHGFANALLEDCGEQLGDLGRNYIASIMEDAVQMNDLISDLLSYSRLTRTQINLQPTALTEVVEEALKQLTAQIQENQAQIEVAAALPQVMAHRSTLIQAVTNLIGNAIKFVEPSTRPQIDIFAEETYQNERRWIRMWIVDNAIGIAPEHQERVFRVFERLHGAESYPGTGIGLAIVRKGLERMGGQVGVESQLGRGSRFWIALPMAVPPSMT